MKMTQDQAFKWVNKLIEGELKYKKMGISYVETTHLPIQLVSDVQGYWQSQEYVVSSVTSDNKSWMAISKNVRKD